MRVRKKVLLILTILMTLFIWGQSMVPMEISSSESSAISNVISNTSMTLKKHQNSEKQNNSVKHVLNTLQYIRNHLRKIAHVFEYTILGVLLLLLINMYEFPFSKQIYYFCTIVFLIGFLDESIQMISILNRSAEINDVWLDFLGSLLGGAVALIIIQIRERKRHD